eukprot:365751-Chlamydomonas_euryale.AAC.7
MHGTQRMAADPSAPLSGLAWCDAMMQQPSSPHAWRMRATTAANIFATPKWSDSTCVASFACVSSRWQPGMGHV